MNKPLIIIITLLILLFALLLYAFDLHRTTTSAPKPTATLSMGQISGKVLDSKDGTAVSLANVSTDPPTSSMTTDGEGRYLISHVSPGNYTMIARKQGYAETRVNIAVTPNQTTTADIHLTGWADSSTTPPINEPRRDDGLIAYYPFDGHVNDASGNKNHGEAHGGVAYTAGKRGQAARFDGVDDYIEISPQSEVSAIGDFTISVWTYVQDWKPQTNSHKDRQYIFSGHAHSKTTTSDFYRQGFGLIYDGDFNIEEIHNYIEYKDDNFLEQNTQIPIKGEWHFMLFMRKGQQDYTYLDGQRLPATYYRNNKRDDPLNMNHPWFIGTFSGNNPHYDGGLFNYAYFGLLDELRIYNRALSEAEIQAVYEADR